jgi:hypothetical protein
MIALAEVWRPLRAVAARVLWTYYRAIKGRDGAPVAVSRATKSLASSGRGKPSVSKQKRSPRGRNGR